MFENCSEIFILYLSALPYFTQRIARRGQLKCAAAISRNLISAVLPASPTESTMQVSATANRINSSNSLSFGFQGPMDNLQSTSGLKLIPTTFMPTSTKKPFKIFMQTYIDIVKNQATVKAQALTMLVSIKSKKQPLKAGFPDIYFKKLHLNCYWFCQQWKNHFNMAKANKNNSTLFAAFILRRD